MLDFLWRRIVEARLGKQLFFAALVSPETIASNFDPATAILDSVRIDTTSIKL